MNLFSITSFEISSKPKFYRIRSNSENVEQLNIKKDGSGSYGYNFKLLVAPCRHLAVDVD